MGEGTDSTDSGRMSRWERLYQDEDVKSLPWYYPDLDPDFERALRQREIDSGSALDLCTGPGTQALGLAERGLTVTATDVSLSAVEKASELARDRGLKIDFLQNDILSNGLRTSFDYVFDRGCFHVFPPERRDQYVETVSGLLQPGGYLFLKCFSYKEEREDGPYRLHPDEIRDRFRTGFDVVSIDESRFHSDSLDPAPIALFCILRRR